MVNELKYSYTNESLDAIVTGLDVQHQDVILAVAGSGDQPLALLEKAAKVIAVDTNVMQLELLRKRTELLRGGSYWRFLRPKEKGISDGVFFSGFDGSFPSKKTRRRYFSEKNRIRTIAGKVDSLEILEPMEVARAVEKGVDFTKVYLSNSMKETRSFPLPDSLMCILSQRLPFDGLVYMSNAGMYGFFQESCFLPPNIVLDRELTQIARDRE